MTAAQLRDALECGDKLAIYDVRLATDREWVIPGAIPLDIHDRLWANDPTALAAFHPPKGREIVFVCARGNTSMLAVRQARSLGISAASLFGGMKAWSAQWNTAAVTANGLHADVIQVRRTGKGCLSYLVGSLGVAVVIDPSVDPEVYLDLAKERSWRITQVIDTHVHADHVSRARLLAARAGARVLLPEQQRVRFPFDALKDGDTLKLGDSTLEIVATPGHTFESACLLLDGRALFTGDTLFLTTVGRPDLAAKADEETRRRAALLHGSLQRIARLPKETLVLPAHTSQPVAFDDTPLVATLADVRRHATLLSLGEKEFVDAVLAHIPPPPANHLKIVQLNEAGSFPADVADLEVGGNRCAVG
ncbi:MAG: MBL fold metallo-hydrolase [Gemmatimonadetes bacterium]|nr:MBL fold metallo-hydrolase [Gemmatimonadota bacterium]